MRRIMTWQLRKGCMTGIVVGVLTAGGLLAAVQATHAQGADTTTIWSGLVQGANLFDTSSGNTSNAKASGTIVGSVWNDTSASSTGTVTGTTTRTYAALGDSVAAGLGLPLVANASSQDQTCGRSSQAYAFEAGRQLGYAPTLVACSGATAGDLISQQGVDGPNPRSQISVAYANGRPDLISITAGANDIYWNRFVQKCYVTSCGSSTDTASLRTALALMRTKYRLALADIAARGVADGTGPPTVIMTSYYDPFSTACASQQTNLTTTEISWLSNSLDLLNQSIRTVAAGYPSFAHYAPVDFSGHDICSSSPWVQSLTSAAPIHPTTDGQQAIARTIVQAAGTSR